MWTYHFLNAQDYNVGEHFLYRDMSSMKLKNNGKFSSGKRTRHFNIKFFYITNLIERGLVKTKYCPTDYMIADYMTKPLTGAKFHQFRQDIINFRAKKVDDNPSNKDEAPTTMLIGWQECVGRTEK